MRRTIVALISVSAIIGAASMYPRASRRGGATERRMGRNCGDRSRRLQLYATGVRVGAGRRRCRGRSWHGPRLRR